MLGFRVAYGGVWAAEEVPLDVLYAKVKAALSLCRSNHINVLAKARKYAMEGRAPPSGVLKWCKAAIKQFDRQVVYSAERARICGLAPLYDSHLRA